MAPRFLVLGATGVVGRYLCRYLGADALATWHNHPVPGGVRFDACTMRLSETVLAQNPGLTHAFILLGITYIDACARDPGGSAGVNVTGVMQVIDDLMAAGVVPVFTSTDAVFDGRRGGWSEADPVSPILTYGRQKVEIEQYLAGRQLPSLTVRLCKVIDPDTPPGDWLGDALSQLERGQTIQAARDQVFTPVAADEVAAGLVQLAQQGATGLFHMGGPQACSRLDLMQRLVVAAPVHLASAGRCIVPSSIRDFPFAEPRPLDTSLSSGKLYRALGKECSGLDALCQRIVHHCYGDSFTLSSNESAADRSSRRG
jgi:dTDP-4-dehydrorhamnose reductase